MTLIFRSNRILRWRSALYQGNERVWAKYTEVQSSSGVNLCNRLWKLSTIGWLSTVPFRVMLLATTVDSTNSLAVKESRSMVRTVVLTVRRDLADNALGEQR
jgi:hypothetical protein